MCYGLSSAIVYYSGPWDIFAKFRESVSDNEKLSELFSCMFCLPTNIGIIMSLLNMMFSPNQAFTPFNAVFNCNQNFWPLIIMFDAFYTGAIVSIIDTIVDRLSTQTTNKTVLND